MFDIRLTLSQIGAGIVALLRLSANLPTETVKEHEKIYFDPVTNRTEKFGSLFDGPTKSLSVIVPAYNEEERLPAGLDDMLTWLNAETKRDSKFSFEIIVVDDGSRDKTAEVGYSYARKFGSDTIRVLRINPNGGKGHAVKKGMLVARGKDVMYADADGAALFSDTANLLQEVRRVERNGYGIAVGSRNHLVRKAVATRKWYRNILMHGFHFAVWLLAVRTIQDTQCGFKLFTRKAAQVLFTNQRLPRWGFDVELLHLAEKLRIPMSEMGVNWTEVPGSKLNIVGATITISKDLLLIRFNYLLGLWPVKIPQQLKGELPIQLKQ